MCKKTKITYLVLAALSFIVLILALVVGILIYRDVSSYYSYFEYHTVFMKHTQEGITAIVGAVFILIAIAFYIVTAVVANKKRAYLFPVGSTIALFVSSILQFVAVKRYFSSTDSIPFESTIIKDIVVDYCNILNSSGILCIVLLVATIVFITIKAIDAKKTQTVVQTRSYVPISQSKLAPVVKKPSVGFEDGITQITYFYELYSAGILTEQEFADQKTRIFSNMGIDKITGEDL